MIAPFLISLGFFLLYMSMQTLSIYAGDSGELVAAAYTWSVAHPPGYPLYMLLGGMFTHGIPFLTPAWRMGLLSSLPMALSIVFVWKSIYLCTKSKLAASSGSVIFGFLYPAWLYGIVPEVFGLFSLFSALILYEFLHFLETKKNSSSILLLSFLIGLSLAHHHLILLLLFSMGMTMFFSFRQRLSSLKASVWKSCILFCLGFSVYVYAPIVSSRYPPFDWEHSASISGFIRLITRASYGTFRATVGTGESFFNRGLNLLTLFQYIYNDFTIFGILFFCIGIIWLWKKKRSYAYFFLVYLGWQVFYFFYAGFTLTSDFALGTLERFFIIPYQIISILIGVGVAGGLQLLRTLWQNHRSQTHIPFFVVQSVVILLSLVIPLRCIKRYYQPLRLLKYDTTLEKLADDIFQSTPTGGILNLTDDTSSFAVYYGYYVQKKRPDIRFLLFPLLQYPWYPQWIRTNYPDILLPRTPEPVGYKEYLEQFLKANDEVRPILSERVDASVPDHWVPRGLLVMYYPDLTQVPPRDQILRKNAQLWKNFQNPLQGVLGTYKHMMMTDTLRYYTVKRLTLAQSFVLYGSTDEGQMHMKEAVRLSPDLDLFLPYIETLISQKQCSQAKEVLTGVKNPYVPRSTVVAVYHRLYTSCNKEDPTLSRLEEEYRTFISEHGLKIE